MKEGLLPWLIVFGLVCIGIKKTIDIFSENPVPPMSLGLFSNDVDTSEEILWESNDADFSIMADDTDKETMLVKIRDGEEIIELAQITRIKKYDKDAQIFKLHERRPIQATRIGLSTLEQKLGNQARNFFRTKSDLINLKHVRRVKSSNMSENGKNYQFTIYMKDNNQVPISHKLKPEFMEKLKAVNGY